MAKLFENNNNNKTTNSIRTNKHNDTWTSEVTTTSLKKKKNVLTGSNGLQSSYKSLFFFYCWKGTRFFFCSAIGPKKKYVLVYTRFMCAKLVVSIFHCCGALLCSKDDDYYFYILWITFTIYIYMFILYKPQPMYISSVVLVVSLVHTLCRHSLLPRFLQFVKQSNRVRTKNI